MVQRGPNYVIKTFILNIWKAYSSQYLPRKLIDSIEYPSEAQGPELWTQSLGWYFSQGDFLTFLGVFWTCYCILQTVHSAITWRFCHNLTLFSGSEMSRYGRRYCTAFAQFLLDYRTVTKVFKLKEDRQTVIFEIFCSEICMMRHHWCPYEKKLFLRSPNLWNWRFSRMCEKNCGDRGKYQSKLCKRAE